MSAKFTWSPEFAQLQADLGALPESLAGESAKIVEGRANGAAVTIKRGYPVRTGNLRDKLTVTHTQPPLAAKSVIKNTAPHARIFERGTQVRSYVTVNGKTHVTGRMPPNPLFSQTIMRERRGMYQDLRAMLERHGLTVTETGDA